MADALMLPDEVYDRGAEGGADAGARPEQPGAEAQKRGYLLDEKDGKKVCDFIAERLWKPQAKKLSRLDKRWQANELILEGVPNVRVIEDTDTSSARLYVPHGASAGATGIPKTRRLVERTVATVMVDPPMPEVSPAGDEDDERDAADLAQRILRDSTGEGAINYRADMERAMQLGAPYGSGFILSTVDPQGGGWVPMEVLAHPEATHYDDADPEAVLSAPAPAMDPAMAPQDGGAMLPGLEPLPPGEFPDPNGSPDSGLPGMGGVPAEPEQELAFDFVKRFVMPDGSLSESAIGARKVWRERLVHTFLTGRHLRFLPETADSVADAKGVVICQPMTLGAIKATFCDYWREKYGPEWDGTLDEQTEKDLVGWRPTSLKKVLPPGIEVEADGKPTDKDGRYTDDALALVFTVYYVSHGQYPEGAYVCVAGKGHKLHAQVWCAEVGEGEHAREECLDLPVAQFRWRRDATGANPYGKTLVEALSPGDDLRGSQMAAVVEYLYRFNNPNVYLPLGSVVQPGELARRDGTPIMVNPDGAPFYEQFPALPPDLWRIYAQMGDDMDSESGLEETAQGAEASTSVSGKAKQIVVEQALVALSGVRNAMQDGFTRLCRVDLQLMRAFYGTEQLLSFTGDDGSYRSRGWTRADLRGVKDVRIARGTFTMLSRSAKQQLAMQELEVGLKAGDPEAFQRYARATAGNMDALLGREDDPHKQRVLRQIAEWLEGPDEADGPVDPAAQEEAQLAAQPQPQLDPATGQAAVDPMTGQPVMAPPPPDPRAAAIWAPVGADEVPWVARVRHDEMARTMATKKYARLQQAAPLWVAPFDAAYVAARQAAGIQTVAEQALAAQQQAEAQQQQADADRQQKTSSEETKVAAGAAEADAKRAFDGEQKQLDRESQAERDSGQQAAAMDRAAMQTAARAGQGTIR